ncbi:rhodanese-related sulfurtransferase [Salibacterium salarium]|nr:rhodanese-related sulfurtransferase [Salibacterium salarium]
MPCTVSNESGQKCENSENMRLYENISPQELQKENDGGNVRILDVRFQDEREREHIPGVQHIMLGYLPSKMDQELPPRDKPVGGPLRIR